MKTTHDNKKFANHVGYSDVHPYEVINASTSGKVLTVRSMAAVRDPDWKPEMVAGGFAGHCTNQNAQQWIITPDPKGIVVKIRLHKDGRWYDSHKARYALSNTPRKFYDYNF